MSAHHEQRRRWRFYRSPAEGPDDLPIARQEMMALGNDVVAALAEVMQRYKAGTCRANEVKALTGSGGLLELRVQLGKDPYRLIFFHDGPVNLAVLALYKNQERLPKRDLDLAKKRMSRWKDAARQ